MKEGLSKELAEFIILHVDSVELLEVLVLLHSQPARSWTIFDLDAVIRSNAASIEIRLIHLSKLGFAMRVGDDPAQYRYHAASPEIGAIANSLVLAYHTRRVEITELIYAQPMKEIVSFSNAFRLRGGGGKKDG